MTKPKGRYVAKAADAPAKTPKALKTAAALHAVERRKLEKQHAALLQARDAWELRRAEASAEASAASAANETELASIAAAREAAMAEAQARPQTFFGHAGRTPSDAERAQAAATREKLRFKSGEILNETQSRSILLVYSRCVMLGCSPEAAVAATADTLGVGARKVYNVSTAVLIIKPLSCFHRPEIEFSVILSLSYYRRTEIELSYHGFEKEFHSC